MKKNNPDISIIVPAYNAEKHISKCLNSLLSQTKKELEFIIINDGSTDQTEKIIKSFSDKRLIYFKNKNQGIGKTRNFGIEKATGQYIMFLDSDDYLVSTACEVLFTAAQKNSLDLVIADFYKKYPQSLEEIHTPDFAISSLKENPDIITEYLNPWAKLYNRKMLIDNNIKFVENLKYECLNYYVIHSNSETTIRDERCFDILKIITIIRNYTQDKDYLKEKIDKLTVRIITNYTIQQRMQKDKKIAQKFINEAFLYLKENVPDYKDNKYYANRGFLRRTIEKNKTLTQLYCLLYR